MHDLNCPDDKISARVVTLKNGKKAILIGYDVNAKLIVGERDDASSEFLADDFTPLDLSGLLVRTSSNGKNIR